MWRTSPRSERERGVSLIEFLVYITLVVLILVVSAQLLFSMRRSATRVELASEARQTSRQAVEYISRFVRGATDMNRDGNAPMAIVVWYELGNSNTDTQASHNNVTDATLADVGTDIITLARPTDGFAIQSFNWPGYQHASTSEWQFDLACPDSAANMQVFKELTGYDSSTGFSRILVLADAAGQYRFFQITDYNDGPNAGCCSQTPPHLRILANPGLSNHLNPPGGHPDLDEPTMYGGVQFISFRVMNGRLEQKTGMFDPNNPDAGFIEVLPDVVDLQFAWLFDNGELWNNTPAHQLATTGNVPVQDQGTTHTYHAANVVGLRVTATARASEPITWEREARFNRPAAEDHAAATQFDLRYYRRFSSIAMLRNRAPGM